MYTYIYHIYMYIYVYMYTCAYIYIHIYIYTHTYTLSFPLPPFLLPVRLFLPPSLTLDIYSVYSPPKHKKLPLSCWLHWRQQSKISQKISLPLRLPHDITVLRILGKNSQNSDFI